MSEVGKAIVTVRGATAAGDNKIRIAFIYEGYTPEEIARPDFQEALQENEDSFYSQFPAEYFEAVHVFATWPSPLDHFVKFLENFSESYQKDEMESLYRFKRSEIIRDCLNANGIPIQLTQIQEKGYTKAYAGSGLLDQGYAFASVVPGPGENSERKFQCISGPTSSHHELFHQLMALNPDNPTYFGERYNFFREGGNQSGGSEQFSAILQGLHTEFFIEDPKSPLQYPPSDKDPFPPRQPYPSNSDIINRALAKTNPRFYDTGILLGNANGEPHRLLSPSSDRSIMGPLDRDDFTLYQQALIQEAATLHLARRGMETHRLEYAKEAPGEYLPGHFQVIENLQSGSKLRDEEAGADLAQQETAGKVYESSQVFRQVRRDPELRNIFDKATIVNAAPASAVVFKVGYNADKLEEKPAVSAAILPRVRALAHRLLEKVKPGAGEIQH